MVIHLFFTDFPYLFEAGGGGVTIFRKLLNFEENFNVR